MSGPSALVICPANEAGCEDLQQIFGTRGQAARCQCQRYKLRPRESLTGQPAEERTARLQDQTGCGDPRSHGAAAVEAYPMTRAAISEELHVGTLASFLEARFTELGRPTVRRAVVRLDFPSLCSRDA